MKSPCSLVSNLLNQPIRFLVIYRINPEIGGINLVPDAFLKMVDKPRIGAFYSFNHFSRSKKHSLESPFSGTSSPSTILTPSASQIIKKKKDKKQKQKSKEKEKERDETPLPPPSSSSSSSMFVETTNTAVTLMMLFLFVCFILNEIVDKKCIFGYQQSWTEFITNN